MKDTLLNFITKRPNNALIIDFWRTGQRGWIVDYKGDCIYRFVEYPVKEHLSEESILKYPVVACGLVGYWLHKKDYEGIKAIFDGYYELRLKGYAKTHEQDHDAWKRDLKKEFVCQYHIPAENKYMKASEALFAFITESDQKIVKSIMENYLEYANSKRIELYPEEETHNYNGQVFNGPVTIIHDRPTNPVRELRAKFWFDYNNRIHSGGQGGSTASGKSKSGGKETSFENFIVNTDESDRVIALIKKHINKDNPKQVALVIMGGIEAGKIRRDVTAPSIGREFGVNGNSVKPHLTKYRAYKNGRGNSFSEEELKPYQDFFCEK